MKITYKKSIRTLMFAAAVGSFLAVSSCVNDLDQTPITSTTTENIYTNFANYPSALAKVYGGLAHGGQEGGGGNSDINGIDGNFAQYTRILYTLQEIPTDEAKIAWNDGTLQTMNKMTWDASSEFISGAYYRLYTEIAFCNDFIKNTSDEQLAANGISGADLTEAKYMHAEARFIRALSYYYAMDLFGNVPFVLEDRVTGDPTPPQRIERSALFDFVESELLACANDLKDARSNDYGRVDKAAAWFLLSKLYLNASVYNGTNRNADVITYTEKIINAGYSLKSNYQDLFLADNDQDNNETIFAIPFDGIRTKSHGGTSYLIHATIGGKMVASNFGVNGGWGGIRVTSAYVGLFNDSNDKRGNFFKTDQTLEMADLGNFSNGYAYIKFKNIDRNGNAGSDLSGNYPDTDLPLFRLADVYLMYAEANLRGGGGSASTALNYVNAVRQRAEAAPVQSINLDFILSERGRELGWEMTRRTDLVRYGKFTSASYLWAWKGGVQTGVGVSESRNLYPIPAKDIIANPNLIQNQGY